MSIVPHHIQGQYYKEACDAREQGITVEQLRAERKQKAAEAAAKRSENYILAKGARKMAELGKSGWYFTTEFFNGTSIYCYHQTDPYHEKIRHRFDGETLAECFAKLLEAFK